MQTRVYSSNQYAASNGFALAPTENSKTS